MERGRELDHLVNKYIFKSKDEHPPRYSRSFAHTERLIDKLKRSVLVYYKAMFINNNWLVSGADLNTTRHPNQCAAIVIYSLRASGVPEEEINEAIQKYNTHFGHL